METPREPKDFINKIQTLRKRRNYFPIRNLEQVRFQINIQKKITISTR